MNRTTGPSQRKNSLGSLGLGSEFRSFTSRICTFRTSLFIFGRFPQVPRWWLYEVSLLLGVDDWSHTLLFAEMVKGVNNSRRERLKLAFRWHGLAEA